MLSCARGSCLCGAVHYEVADELGAAYYCHCSRCRKASGSAFATNAEVKAQAFRFTSGLDDIRTYETASGLERVFCSRCGSPLISRSRINPAVVRIRLGTLDSPLSRLPHAHAFVASRAPWFEILDSLPQHPERLPRATPPEQSS
jgi:hypothetical protein